jgi:hypothetical protein
MTTTTLSPIATRFAWKEYRTLRGLWLAVLTLGVLVQTVLMLLAAPGADVPTIAFAAAWGTAVLYAIGAAAILFSVEHEEETYGFLAGLPTRWLPLYLGKLGVAAASAFAAAVALMLTGWAVAGGRWPTLNHMAEILGLLGIGIFEALAWGTLFSLLLKRPLVAVLWTIVVSAVVVHWAVNITSSGNVASLELTSYSEAIPLRLTIVALAFAATALVARRWLAADRPRAISVADVPDAVANGTGYLPQLRSRPAISFRVSRRGMFARLLWQTWRNSWKLLLMPFLAAAVLYAGIIGIGGLVIGHQFAALLGTAVAFLLPSLYGALAFGTDQRRASYRFLAEHAARPRYVWISRQAVWLGALLAVATTLAIVAATIAVVSFDRALNKDFSSTNDYWILLRSTSKMQYLHWSLRWVGVGSMLVWLGILAAYGFGQLCSMLMRSEILAAFLAIILSVVLSAWVAVVAVWDLSVWVFLLPLFVGTMAATWLRAPDWIVGRNSWKAWWKPALAVTAPIVLVGLYLPIARRIPAKTYHEVAGWLPTDIYKSMAGERPPGNTSEARKTAEMYEDAPQEAQQALTDKASAAAAKLAIEASRRPTCWFDVDWSSTPVPTDFNPRYKEREQAWSKIHSNYYRMLHMPLGLFDSQLPPAEAAEIPLAAVRMVGHLRQGQPTDVTIRTLVVEGWVLEEIVDWAGKKETPTDQIRAVLDELQHYFASDPLDPAASFAADDRIVRGVLRGKTQPLILAETPIDTSHYLAFLANELPWERRRAFAALDMITMQNFRDAEDLKKLVDGREDRFYLEKLQDLIQPDRNRVDRATVAWVSEQPLAATSYLARFEYQARVPVSALFQQVLETEVARRAAIVRLALLLYRRDHDKYPASLSELVPDYLPEVPKDPFTGNMQNLSYALRGGESSLAPFHNSLRGFRDGTALVWSRGVENELITGRSTLYTGTSLTFPLPK